MRFQALWLSASALALGWTGGAAAQTATPPGQGGPGASTAVQELVITAERRSTALQKTAIAANLLNDKYISALASPIELPGNPRQYGVSIMKTF
jgi:hypothetical protein